MNSTVLVVAPHPDDEVLGVGGTIARLAREGACVDVAIVTKGRSPPFDAALIERGRSEALAAHRLLGVRETLFLDFPAAELDSVPHSDLNRALAAVIRERTPSTVFVPFVGDLHLDHQRIFHSALVAARPNSPHAPGQLYAYETLSETNWNAPYLSPVFQPNVFFDITQDLQTKLRAMSCFQSQLRAFPDERSIEAVEHLARYRGATVSRGAAEAFVLVRNVR